MSQVLLAASRRLRSALRDTDTVARSGDDGFTTRLVGWGRVALEPGETGHVALTVDPRLLARFDTAANEWHIAAGRCTLQAGAHVGDAALTEEVTLVPGRLKP